MTGVPAPRDILRDVGTCLIFYTRLPQPRIDATGPGFAAAQWAAPLAGLAVAVAAALAGSAALSLGVPQGPAAAIALAAALLTTGCLHEDGLADTADGFGGGRTRERKLEIMRDSRIGTFGACALGVTLLLRWSALAAFATPSGLFFALLAAHGASRALVPGFMLLTPAARKDGLSAGIGGASPAVAGTAAAIGVLFLLPLGFAAVVFAASGLAVWLLFWRWLSMRQIGGQTGDVIGALQQGAEVFVLLVASAVLSQN